MRGYSEAVRWQAVACNAHLSAENNNDRQIVGAYIPDVCGRRKHRSLEGTWDSSLLAGWIDGRPGGEKKGLHASQSGVLFRRTELLETKFCVEPGNALSK
jgi:hypothetical protein